MARIRWSNIFYRILGKGKGKIKELTISYLTTKYKACTKSNAKVCITFVFLPKLK